MGAVAGLIIGLLYSCVNKHSHQSEFFNDAILYNYPGNRDHKYEDENRNDGPVGDSNVRGSKVPAILEFDYYAKK